jgi:hypothetical protein
LFDVKKIPTKVKEKLLDKLDEIIKIMKLWKKEFYLTGV